MKKMCFGTFATVLSVCKAPSTTQKQLIGEMLLLVNQRYDIRTDDVAVSALVRGKNNLSNDVMLYLDDATDNLSTKFAQNIISLLDANKKGNIVLAFKDILDEDTDIDGNTKIELINGITKADFLKRESIVFDDLIAGLFLYVAKYTDNHDKKKYINGITDAYIKKFDSRRNDITFIPSYSLTNMDDVKTIAVDAHFVELMTEAEGFCPNCGKALSTDNCSIFDIGNGDDILLCLECGAKLKNHAEEKEHITIVKQAMRDRVAIAEAVTSTKLDDEIREILIKISDISEEDAQLRKTPLSIEKKVADTNLRRKINGYVLGGVYDAINDCVEHLAAENKLNVNKLSKCIRRMFEDAEDQGGSQSQVFNALVQYAYIKNGQQNFEACEMLISYFVQRCEVFNEITEQNHSV